MAKGTNLSVLFADITMFAAEFGVETIPDDHPDAKSFSLDLPYFDSRYDLVFCGGAVLRTQERAPYREKVESARLTLSQLIFAFRRMRQIIHTMSALADIQLFKPQKKHAIKSSFYLIAKNVRSETREAVDAVAEWKRCWYQMTFDKPRDDNIDAVVNGSDFREDAALILKEFGPQLIELGHPIWKIQANALEGSPFLKAR